MPGSALIGSVCGALALGVWLTTAPAAGAENRIWWGDFLLRGPLDALHIDCGEYGSVRLDARLLAGEERRASVPLPYRSPLGERGLASLPKPRIEVTGAAGDRGGGARFLGWSAPQSERRFADLGPALRGRTRPPAPRVDPRARPAELALLFAAGCLLWALRRRTLPLLGLAVLAALGLWKLGARRTLASASVEVLEIDVDAAEAFRQRAGQSRLTLPGTRLEVFPPNRALRFDLSLRGDRVIGSAHAPAGTLVGIDLDRAGSWTPGRAPPEALSAVWLRTPAGSWSMHGAWPEHAPLPPPMAAGSPSAPPGWLAAGLPPGRGILVGKCAWESSRWIRIVGFPMP